MRKFRFVFVLVLVGLCLSACTWPKVYVQTSSGYVSYDKLNHRLEILWEQTTKTPNDSTSTSNVN